MGKNRKPKQVANQSSQSDSEDNNGCHIDVPVQFLTSDDFQVVQKKKNCKKTPDTHEDFPITSRSQHNSCSISVCSEKDVDEALGCHSSFWTNKSQSIDKAADESNFISVNEDTLVQKSVAEFPVADSDACYSTHSNIYILNKTSENAPSGCPTDKTIASSLGEVDIKCHCSNAVFENNVCLITDCKKKWEISKENKEKTQCKNLDTHLLTEIGAGDHNWCCQSNIQSTSPTEKQQSVSSPSVIENSSPINNSAAQAKCQKKKKKQKLKISDANNLSNSEFESHSEGITSSDNSPTECLHITLNEMHCKKDISKQKSEFEKPTDRKRPGKKQLAAIHEALRKAKEDEERVKQEQELKKKRAEEAEKQRLEMIKKEQEKKDKKKLKEKQKKEKLKAEGRLLSKSQKVARARMQATIEIYRQQGVDIPQIGEKGVRPRLCNYKSFNRRRLDSSQSDRSEVSNPTRHKTESLSSQESKESFSDIPSSLESKDSLEFVMGSLTTESDTCKLSCSEESDARDEDHNPSAKSIGFNLRESVEKANLSKIETCYSKPIKPINDTKINVLRSPVVCVLGHVDTGKTKLLDFIRKTHVQNSEAGGITQQIGATMIPKSALEEKCKMVKDFSNFEIEVPGLLVIDTPGHESFLNLRSRGTSLCDIAILVVDIMHGLQTQTIESIKLLRENKIPFLVALNKIDRIYGWKTVKDTDIELVIKSQSESTVCEFKKRCQEVILQFAMECINATLFYENENPRSFVSMVPTSAVTGEGMGNILSLITHLTQTLMYKQLYFSNDLKATVLEVKVIPGLGTTIDVILVNGELHEGDTIVLPGQDGPIVTQIRSLLMPQPLKELRVKNPYIDYKVVRGAQGVKISGKDLDKTLAGMPLLVAHSPSNVNDLKTKISQLLSTKTSSIKTSERGVYVQASTLGSLEALLSHLTSVNIPYFAVKIGPVVKKDVMKASIMLEHDTLYATILAFDVKIERDAQELADHLGVTILQADIIYHLFDMFIDHRESHLKMLEEKRHLAIFPCILTVLSKVSSDGSIPLTLHATVEAGSLRQGTPLCMPKKGNFDIGHVIDILVNGLSVTSAKEGDSVVITIENKSEKPIELDQDDNLVSHINRQSIEVCKEYYRDELCPSDWHLMNELKKVLHNA